MQESKRRKISICNFHLVPPEVISIIFTFLDANEFLSFRTTSKNHNKISELLDSTNSNTEQIYCKKLIEHIIDKHLPTTRIQKTFLAQLQRIHQEKLDRVHTQNSFRIFTQHIKKNSFLENILEFVSDFHCSIKTENEKKRIKFKLKEEQKEAHFVFEMEFGIDGWPQVANCIFFENRKELKEITLFYSQSEYLAPNFSIEISDKFDSMLDSFSQLKNFFSFFQSVTDIKFFNFVITLCGLVCVENEKNNVLLNNFSDFSFNEINI
eukprot:gene3172-5488_t